MLEIVVERYPRNPSLRTYHVGGEGRGLSENEHLFWFSAPLRRPREEDFRKFRLAGEKGEALVRRLCEIAGVTDISLCHDYFGVLARENGNISWEQLESRMRAAVREVFPEEEVVWVYSTPSAAKGN